MITFEDLMTPGILNPGVYARLDKMRLSITCIDPAKLMVSVRQTECVLCGKPVPRSSRKYCSTKCADDFYRQHQWTAARAEALKRNREVNFIVTEITVPYPYIPAQWGRPEIPAHTSVFKRTFACCSICKGQELPNNGSLEALASRLEVDHILPMNGGDRALTCMNHQENLRVVCHTCHLEITKEQRRAGLIGKDAPKRR